MTRGVRLLALVVTGSAALLGAGCQRGAARGASARGGGGGGDPQPILLGAENVTVVSTGVVESGPLVSGTLAPVQIAQIRAQVSGPVLATSAEQGQRVVEGQVLARLDASAIRAAYDAARAAVTSASVAADLAQRQAARYDTLLAAGAVSPRDQETVAEQRSSAQASLDNARSQLASAQKQLAYTEVRAPFAGIVSERDVSAGDVVQPGSALFSVVDPSRLQLQAAVPADQIASVTVGAPVSFSLNGYGGRTFAGRVTRINPMADQSTRQVQVYSEMANPGNALVGGLFAAGRIVTRRDTGLVLPSAAIDTRNLRPAVERVRQGKVERVDITLGVRDQRTDRVQITAGLAHGDTVLLGTAQGLTSGTPVRVTAITDTSLGGTVAR
jgi:membrane fusion protein (multidrug efflux system)